MKIYKALQIGENHLNYCEDYYYIGEVGNDKILCAVMDGCTMATDSYFASTLTGRLLRKIIREKTYKEFYKIEYYASVEEYLKAILRQLFDELRIIKNQLMLETDELLTTLVIMLFDKNINKGIVLVIGDGLVSIDGHIVEYDQQNIPDYLGYHLAEDFEEWYELQKQKLIFHEVSDVSIATDGIFSFLPVNAIGVNDEINPIEFLLFDKTHTQKNDMLNWQLKTLDKEYGLKPADDFAMIRILL